MKKKTKPSGLPNIGEAIAKEMMPYLMDQVFLENDRLLFFAERKIDLYYPFNRAHSLALYQAIAY